MKTAVMQPYFLPYIGYFQLIHAVDQFVVLDDANYINRGWINRNRMLFNNKPHLFTLPLAGASQNRLINEIDCITDHKKIHKQLDTILNAYRKAPCFKDVFGLFEEIFLFPEKNLCQFILNSLYKIADYLEINTTFNISSLMEKNNHLKAQEKILDICRITGTDQYINPIGGMDLYHQETFEKCGIQLSFLKTADIVYHQFGDCFISNLSIMDVLMFNSKPKCLELLNQYMLVKN
jgi:WbqC-like protein